MQEGSFLNPTNVIAAAHIDEGMRVADFGTGAGFFARAAARAVGPGGQVWAVDAHQDMLPRLKNLALGEGLHNVEVVHGSVEKSGGTHLPADSFDFVIIANLLFSIEDRAAVAAEAARVLKKGGKVLVIDWRESFGGLGPHQSHIVLPNVAQGIFEGVGFAQSRDIPAGAYHWGFILKKK